MFQSSRIASGRWRRQASSACSPSSASTISNSSPSRIRRATFRMTLESSTIKHVFIAYPRYFRSYDPKHVPGSLSVSRRDRVRTDIEDAVDVDDDEQLSVHAKDAGCHARQPRIEIDRIGFARGVVELEYLAHAVDQQA